MATGARTWSAQRARSAEECHPLTKRDRLRKRHRLTKRNGSMKGYRLTMGDRLKRRWNVASPSMGEALEGGVAEHFEVCFADERTHLCLQVGGVSDTNVRAGQFDLRTGAIVQHQPELVRPWAPLDQRV